MATTTVERLFGKSIKRREDPRFITGHGTYVDDVKLPGTTYAAFVRSPHGHARIRGVDASQAMKLNGVFAVYTGKDLVDGGVKSLPVGWLLPQMKIPQHLPLAVDRARYMGDAVAVGVAQGPPPAPGAAGLGGGG